MTVNELRARAQAGMNVPVPTLAEAVGCSRGCLYQAISRNEVASVKVGRAIFVPAHEARRLLCIDKEAAPIAA